MLVKLWKHQQKAIEFAKTHEAMALFFDMGTGKTLTTIYILKNTDGRILILCPLALTSTWLKELKKYWPEMMDRVLVLSGTSANRIKQLKLTLAKIVITNYEALSAKNELTEALVKFSPEMLVCDESQKLKKYNGKRFKAVAKISKVSNRKIILTGTPINDRRDIWSQYYILDEGKTFGTNYYSFLAEYFYDMNAGRRHSFNYFPVYAFRQNKLAQYTEKMLSLALVAKKEECVDLPELVKVEVPFSLDPKNRKIYDELEAQFIANLGDSTVSADLIITKLGKLLQISSGFVINDDGNVSTISDSRKIILKELIDAIPTRGKIIVWCNYKQQYKDVLSVCEELEIEAVEAHGDIPHFQQERNIEIFCEDRDVGVLVANPKSIGCGVNLQCSSWSIYYGFGWSLEERLQSEARNYRAGSKDKVTHYYIIAENTIEERIHQTLLNKEKLSLEVLKKWNLKNRGRN